MAIRSDNLWITLPGSVTTEDPEPLFGVTLSGSLARLLGLARTSGGLPPFSPGSAGGQSRGARPCFRWLPSDDRRHHCIHFAHINTRHAGLKIAPVLDTGWVYVEDGVRNIVVNPL